MHHAHILYVCETITKKEFEAINLKVGIGHGGCQRKLPGKYWRKAREKGSNEILFQLKAH